jgi:hypothetical protein
LSNNAGVNPAASIAARLTANAARWHRIAEVLMVMAFAVLTGAGNNRQIGGTPSRHPTCSYSL